MMMRTPSPSWGWMWRRWHGAVIRGPRDSACAPSLSTTSRPHPSRPCKSRWLSSQSPPRRPQSPPPLRPLSLGYVAGLQSSPAVALESGFGSYDEAYDGLTELLATPDDDDPATTTPPEGGVNMTAMLRDFEDEVRLTRGLVFRHSTRKVSVIDWVPAEMMATAEEDGGERPGDGGGDGDGAGEAVATRFLVINDRPELVQSAVEIARHDDDDDSDTGGWRPRKIGAPPPLCGPASTHLGGLALAVPLRRAASSRPNEIKRPLCPVGAAPPSVASHRRPRAVVLGAGGCAVPAVLSVAAGFRVTAVESCDDVADAARRCFGVGEAGIDLVGGRGEDYLLATATERRRRRMHEHGEGGDDTDDGFDIIIIDAEDGGGGAPPTSMRAEDFWTGAVLPSLRPGGVAAANVIGTREEREELRRTVERAFLDVDYRVWYCGVPHVAGVSDRHALLFVTPAPQVGATVSTADVRRALEGSDLVDREAEWMEEIEKAVLRIEKDALSLVRPS